MMLSSIQQMPLWKALALSARPKTLICAIIPVLVGTALATTAQVSVDYFIAIMALLFALFIQIGTNLINDALDVEKGSDTKERLGPIRPIHLGFLSVRQVFAWGVACFMLAILVGIPLLEKGGLPVFFIIFFSVLFGYLYTGGPWPLSYLGIAEPFVLFFFGWVATGSSYYIQTGFFDLKALLAGAEIGFLSTAILAITNLRDIKEDKKTNKKTLAVRFGVNFAKWEITFLILGAFGLNVLWMYFGYLKAAGLPFIAFPLSGFILRHIWATEPSAVYNKFLPLAGLVLLLFGITLSVGFQL